MSITLKRALEEASDTKEKLHLHALDAYLKDGAHNTTFQSLARELGISQAAIYKYYRSKDELLVGAISYAAEKGRRFLLQDENHKLEALMRFKAHVKNNLNFCIEAPLLSVAVITLHYFAICIPEVKKLHEEINNTRIKRIENYILQCIHEKSVPKDIDIKTTAEQIHSLLLGEMVKTFIWPKEVSLNVRSKNLWNSILVLMKAE